MACVVAAPPIPLSAGIFLSLPTTALLPARIRPPLAHPPVAFLARRREFLAAQHALASASLLHLVHVSLPPSSICATSAHASCSPAAVDRPGLLFHKLRRRPVEKCGEDSFGSDMANLRYLLAQIKDLAFDIEDIVDKYYSSKDQFEGSCSYAKKLLLKEIVKQTDGFLATCAATRARGWISGGVLAWMDFRRRTRVDGFRLRAHGWISASWATRACADGFRLAGRRARGFCWAHAGIDFGELFRTTRCWVETCATIVSDKRWGVFLYNSLYSGVVGISSNVLYFNTEGVHHRKIFTFAGTFNFQILSHIGCGFIEPIP